MITNNSDEEIVTFVDRYDTLSIELVIYTSFFTAYLFSMSINGEEVKCVPQLYLDEHINEVVLEYRNRNSISGYFGDVITKYNNISLKNYLPQIIKTANVYFTVPRAYFYKGAKIGDDIVYPYPILAAPLDLTDNLFYVWRQGICFILDYSYIDGSTGMFGGKFEVFEAFFCGELLPPETIDDYVELKPKGV